MRERERRLEMRRYKSVPSAPPPPPPTEGQKRTSRIRQLEGFIKTRSEIILNPDVTEENRRIYRQHVGLWTAELCTQRATKARDEEASKAIRARRIRVERRLVQPLLLSPGERDVIQVLLEKFKSQCNHPNDNRSREAKTNCPACGLVEEWDVHMPTCDAPYWAELGNHPECKCHLGAAVT